MNNGPKKRTKVIVGGIALAVIFGAILVSFQGQALLSGSLASYEIEFVNVLNLIEHSSAVRVDGVNVGKVTGTRQEDATGVVEIGIESGIEVKADATAKLNLQSILGQKYIELDPGTASEPLRGRITVESTTGASDLGSLLGDTTPAIEGLDTDEITETLDLVGETTSKYTTGSGDSIAKTAEALESMVKNQADLFGMLTQTENLTTTLVEQTRRVEAIAADAQATIETVRAFAESQGPRMLSILNDVLALKNVVDRNIANLEAVMDQTPQLLSLTRVLVNQVVANITQGEYPVPIVLEGLGAGLAKDLKYPDAQGND